MPHTVKEVGPAVGRPEPLRARRQRGDPWEQHDGGAWGEKRQGHGAHSTDHLPWRPHAPAHLLHLQARETRERSCREAGEGGGHVVTGLRSPSGQPRVLTRLGGLEVAPGNGSLLPEVRAARRPRKEHSGSPASLRAPPGCGPPSPKGPRRTCAGAQLPEAPRPGAQGPLSPLQGLSGPDTYFSELQGPLGDLSLTSHRGDAGTQGHGDGRLLSSAQNLLQRGLPKLVCSRSGGRASSRLHPAQPSSRGAQPLPTARHGAGSGTRLCTNIWDHFRGGGHTNPICKQAPEGTAWGGGSRCPVPPAGSWPWAPPPGTLLPRVTGGSAPGAGSPPQSSAAHSRLLPLSPRQPLPPHSCSVPGSGKAQGFPAGSGRLTCRAPRMLPSSQGRPRPSRTP